MRLPWRHGYIEAAAWLADDTLLAGGWCLAPADALEAWLDVGGRTIPLEARWMGYSRPDLPDRPHPAGKIIVVGFPRPEDARPLRGTLVLQAGRTRVVTTPASLTTVTRDPATTVRSRVGWADARTRAGVMAFLLGALDRIASPAIARHLAEIRDVLRAPREARQRRTGEPVGVALDRVFRIDDRSFYVSGWAYDASGDRCHLTVVSPEGERAEIPAAFRYARPDVDEVYAAPGARAGFIAHVQLQHASILGDGWLVELVGSDGSTCEASAPPVIRSVAAIRDAILGDLDVDPLGTRLLEQHAYPALDRIQQRHVSRVVASDVVDLGGVPASPTLSIVVPLYRRLDFLEHQLAHFVDDPAMREVELIYVLDSPELTAELRAGAADLHELYRLPFRVVVYDDNLGFARANNQGAAVARGRLLLLLNSDVVPAKPGWTTDLIAFHDAHPGVGAVGPKLLFEDDTLQHAGLYFAQRPGSPVWANEHFYKGCERTLPAANVARTVPAVTAACLLIDRALYLRHGGLRGLYVRGDYEDSDLCLRLREAGHESWYVPDVELYHLEGQSFSGPERARTSRYNAWLHTRLWGETIEGIMAAFDRHPLSTSR